MSIKQPAQQAKPSQDLIRHTVLLNQCLNRKDLLTKEIVALDNQIETSRAYIDGHQARSREIEAEKNAAQQHTDEQHVSGSGVEKKQGKQKSGGANGGSYKPADDKGQQDAQH